MRIVVFTTAVVVAILGCRKGTSEPPPAATLVQASGPVERGPGGEDFAAIAFGAKLHLGDHVRTHAGTAELALGGGGKIVMDPETTIVLRARDDQVVLDVGSGAVMLDGTGTYVVELGEVRLVNGRARLGAGAHTVELVVGEGVLLQPGSPERALQIGAIVLLQRGDASAVPDASVRAMDASIDVSIDAEVATDELAVDVTGAGAALQLAGTTAWTPLPAGRGRIPAGARLRLDATTTATIEAPAGTLALGGGARVRVGPDRGLALELGSTTSTVAGGQRGSVGVPGGAVTQEASGTQVVETRIDVDARGDARIVALSGTASVHGKRAAAPLELASGGSAVLSAAGRTTAGDTVIPAYHDYELIVGTLPVVTIHDPTGATAVRFAYPSTPCPRTGLVELDADRKFRAPQITAGKDAANLLVRAGAWNYRLRCGIGGTPVASGRIIVLRDRGTRPLPKDPPRYPVDADGRTYRLSYQSQIPDIQIRSKGTGAAELRLTSSTGEQVVKSTTGVFAVAGTMLRETQYTFQVVQGGQTSKPTTLIIGFDQTAAQVYIEAPPDGRPWGAQVEVRGATLPGWTAQVAGVEIPADRVTRRFHATISPPTARAIAIQLSHAQRGVHVYLRRQQ